MVFDLGDNDAKFIYLGEQRMTNGASYFAQVKLYPKEGTSEQANKTKIWKTRMKETVIASRGRIFSHVRPSMNEL